MNATLCPAEPNPDYCAFVLANPDISVRISVYVQVGLNVLTSVLFESNVQITRDAARMSYVLSISLIVASIAQWKVGGIGLFDALIGTQLATLMTVFMIFNMRYTSSLGLSANVSSVLFFILYTYWGIQTWSFTPCPANSLTQFVVFVFGVAGILALRSLLLLVKWGGKVWARGGEVKARKAEVWMNHKRGMYGVDDGAGKSHLSLVSLPIILYLVITTEQFVARNKSAHDLENLDDWTFGQTIAVLMLLGQIVEMGLCAWKERKWKKRLQWRRGREKGRGRGRGGEGRIERPRGMGVPLPFVD
ncbi:hypothetical protein BN14_08086 [Rhizoctonia solani AG-1 IB]|uniref:Uncharacterized protein n=1 Tax=Thanatephorus cucumeris (strain AG1-IB / isolate 7/3/14) TaxID=1108050 RepID=M5C4M8_THACB|nr:hypothetical protein BN14_08086 [Rhizoctonia solani AG-1 IB]